ncbi:hypothetical protein Angca_002121 [Angiostrongylus cantonensis]|nr:hypothetical protein Angca_002121 [Angiostrongylus cantonensis]
MNGRNIFWRQLGEYVDNYGLVMIAVTITSSILIGYALHYIVHIHPAKRKQIMDTLNSEEASEDRKDKTNGLVNDTLTTKEQKQVGIVQGVINSDLVSSLRKFRHEDDRVNPFNSTTASEAKPVSHRRMTEMPCSENEDDDYLIDAQNSRKKRSASLQEKDLFNNLGKLHGKLATAQLRARTKKMLEDMTLEQRNDEARTKAEQLESIINLMMQNKEKFGITSKDDINEQLKMYNF